MPVEIIDAKKKNTPEVLLITKRVRAKGEDDSGLARIYEPGEEIRIKGSGKLALLAMGKATRDLNYDIKADSKKLKGKRDEVKEETKKKENQIPPPKLNALKNPELDEYAEVSLGLDTKGFKTRAEKIAAIKIALKNAGN